MMPADLPTPTEVRRLRPRRAPRDGDISPQLAPDVRASGNAVLCAILCTGDRQESVAAYRAAAAVVCAADFGDRCAETIFTAIESLVEDDAPIDRITVTSRIVEQDQAHWFRAYGNGDPLAYVVNVVEEHNIGTGPDIAVAHARVVKSAALRFQTIQDGEELADLAKVDPEAFRARVVELAKESPEPAPADKPRPQWTSAADRARRIGQDVERTPFFLPTLTTATRGGIGPGKIIAVGGAPGAGKTSLFMNQALAWARAGVLVGILAADEDADGLLIRIGQQLGIDRGALERGYPVARAELAAALEELPNLILVDSEEEVGATIDALAEELVLRRQPNQLAVMILDSLQTVQPEMDERQARDVRERVDTVVKTMKRLARRQRLAFVATSEVSRGSYNTADKNRQTSPLAAFKESGGIEYGVAVALVMAKVKNDDGSYEIEVTVAKNRLGGHDDLPVFHLSMNARTATFEEVAVATDAEVEKADVERMNQLRTHVLRVIQQAKVPLTSKNLIIDRLKGAKDSRGRNLGASRSDWLKAIAELEDGNFIKQEKKGAAYALISD